MLTLLVLKFGLCTWSKHVGVDALIKKLLWHGSDSQDTLTGDPYGMALNASCLQQHFCAKILRSEFKLQPWRNNIML